LGTPAQALLWPLAALWTWVAARRTANGRPIDPGAPVICIGNLTLGGAGKTPVAREIARRLRARGVEAHILTRGYGGALKGPVRVDPSRHTAAEVGDEAVMMAADAPVWAARRRAEGALAAARAGARAIVMDDGHQNPSVSKVLSLVVVDGETRQNEWPFGDGRVFPAGPMREPLNVGLARADAVVMLLAADAPPPDPDLLRILRAKPILLARLEALHPPPQGPQVGFAGLGKPWKMERALRAAGCDLVAFIPLADHETPRRAKLERLAARAQALGAGLITSEKDWSRLPTDWRDRATPWPVRARFEDEAALDALLSKALGEG
jgi:tetraacyldisaccharide 4'-kinase